MSTIIINGVTYYSEPTIVSDKEQELKGMIEEVQYQLERMEVNAKVLYEDFQKQGLTFGTIEAEGYLRGLIEINEWIKDMTK